MKNIKDFFEEEASSFRRYRKEIDIINYSMFKYMIALSTILFAILVIVSFGLKEFLALKIPYLIGFLISISLIALFIKRRAHSVLIVGMYVFYGLIIMVGIYLSAIESPTSQGASIIGLLIIMPLAIVDKSWRIVVAMVVFYLLFIFSSYLAKSPSLFIDDAITGAIFTITGLMFGRYTRKIKLNNIMNQHRLRMLSDTDALTRLFNRRKLKDVMRESGEDITGVLMVDIDFFKQYNDEYGHQQGDVCLEEIGACLQRIARLYQLKAFRYGGEEFILISEGHHYDELYLIATELKKEIKRLRIPFHNSPFDVITVSIGVSEKTVCHRSTVNELIELADKALYYGKRNGRNTVIGYTVNKNE